jgi:hypothetical protein
MQTGSETAHREVSWERLFRTALWLLPLVSLACLPWGWEAAASALIGGAVLLLAASLTQSAVAGALAGDDRRLKRRLWLRLGWRLPLLALGLYAMVQATWVRLPPLIAGLSLFFPALVVEFILVHCAPRGPAEKREATTRHPERN